MFVFEFFYGVSIVKFVFFGRGVEKTFFKDFFGVLGRVVELQQPPGFFLTEIENLRILRFEHLQGERIRHEM